jgi:uncharacterized protein
MIYLDTSVIVAALTNEATAPSIYAWLDEQDESRLTISEWTLTEVSSALSIKLRTGELKLEQRAAALAMFNSLVTENLAVLGVTSAHFLAASQYADQHTLNLRAGDALHLAIAAEQNATVCTLDHRMAKAGPALGLQTQLLA